MKNGILNFIRRFYTEEYRKFLMSDVDDASSYFSACEYDDFDEYFDDLAKRATKAFVLSFLGVDYISDNEISVKLKNFIVNYIKKEWYDVALEFYKNEKKECNE